MYRVIPYKIRRRAREIHIGFVIFSSRMQSNSDVLLTVHLSIILVINQLNAQNLVL